jgi:hypothetical protein
MIKGIVAEKFHKRVVSDTNSEDDIRSTLETNDFIALLDILFKKIGDLNIKVKDKEKNLEEINDLRSKNQSLINDYHFLMAEKQSQERIIEIASKIIKKSRVVYEKFIFR